MQQKGSLFDHLVGAVEQVQRHDDPERLSSLEVDHQLEHSRLHYRQISWLRTLEDAPCIDAGLAANGMSALCQKRTLEPYSITSLAVASSDDGMVRPSALAVLRLITSSYLVGACTGRSDGFSPLRIRST